MDRNKTQRNELMIRSALRIGLVLFLLFPFLFLFFQFSFTELPDFHEFWWAFKNSALQAFFSALFSLILGFWVSLGLIRVQQSCPAWLKLAQGFCLLPNFLPTLFILLAVLNTLQPFPMGLMGIVLIHTLINFGLVAVLLKAIYIERVGPLSELAYIEGASRFLFIRKAFLPLIKKELLLIGLFVFVVCFGSFAVPLVVGGGKGTTLEVLIYEKIRLSHEWGQAVILAFLQSAFIFVLSFLAGFERRPHQQRQADMTLLGASSGVVVLGGISLFYLWGYVTGVVNGLEKWSFFQSASGDILRALGGSLFIGLMVGLLTYLGLLCISYCWPQRWFEKFLAGYVAPSTALACFGLLIISPNEGWYSYLKIPVALTLLTLNGLHRLGWQSALQGLENQMTVAYAMGATPEMTFRRIVFPQIEQRAALLAGLASVWACGDFAASRILAHRDITIAMMTETLMAGYRLHHAFLLSVLIILAALICFALIWGGSRVLGRKFSS